jgi:hypothetical protein
MGGDSTPVGAILTLFCEKRFERAHGIATFDFCWLDLGNSSGGMKQESNASTSWQKANRWLSYRDSVGAATLTTY